MTGIRKLALTVTLVLVTVVGAACGSWKTNSKPMPVPAAHVALLHTGKVLLVAGSGANKPDFDAGTFRTSIWDPVTNTFSAVATPWDAFCAGHAFMPDGRLLVAGGTSKYPSDTNGYYGGSRQAFIFDPISAQYVAARDSTVARWYPTVVELGDGRLLTLGGFNENRVRTRNHEIFDGTQWTDATPPPPGFPLMPTYPALHLMRDGRLFYSGANVLGTGGTLPGIWDIAANTFRKIHNLQDRGVRDEAMSVLLPPAQDQRVMIMGGGRTNGTKDPTASTAIIDLRDPEPRYVQAPPMEEPKIYPSAVILPDSTVLQTGGASTSVKVGNNPVFSAQIFDPKTNTWTKAADSTVPRVYHSSALLLPDGRVATFGGNPQGSFEMRIEIYTPAYLEKDTPRPTITSGPTEMTYGGSYAFGTTQSSAIRSAVLVRPAAVTHSSDSNQRLIRLTRTNTTTGVTLGVPLQRNVTPPGWYMLFVVDTSGVPSVAKWVHVT